jgi:hypothetical protein
MIDEAIRGASAIVDSFEAAGILIDMVNTQQGYDFGDWQLR